eukprot:jgi/Botrbrau1/14814/Bobra.0332s0007.1
MTKDLRNVGEAARRRSGIEASVNGSFSGSTVESSRAGLSSVDESCSPSTGNAGLEENAPWDALEADRDGGLSELPRPSLSLDAAKGLLLQTAWAVMRDLAGPLPPDELVCKVILSASSALIEKNASVLPACLGVFVLVHAFVRACAFAAAGAGEHACRVRVSIRRGGGGGCHVRGPEQGSTVIVIYRCRRLTTYEHHTKEMRVVEVASRRRPPPASKNRSCVYVLRTGDAFFYVGETDDIEKRLRDHRSSSRLRGRGGVDAAYLMVPEGLEGKSMAKAIEALAIQQLESAGFPLLSSRDSRNRNAPRRSAPDPATAEASSGSLPPDSAEKGPAVDSAESLEASMA